MISVRSETFRKRKLLDFIELGVSSRLLHDIPMQNGHLERKLSVNNCGCTHGTLSQEAGFVPVGTLCQAEAEEEKGGSRGS